MKDVDKAILGLLVESELKLTPSNIAENTGYSGGYIRKRCTRLAEFGVLEKDDAGSHPFYQVTEKGRSYFNGEIQVDGLADE